MVSEVYLFLLFCSSGQDQEALPFPMCHRDPQRKSQGVNSSHPLNGPLVGLVVYN